MPWSITKVRRWRLSVGRVRAPERKGRTALPEMFVLLRIVVFSREGAGRSEGAEQGRGICCGAILDLDCVGPRPWRKPWCSRTGRILRTGLGDAIWCCLQNGIQCNPPPPTWLPHFIKVCHFHKCVVWIGFVFFGGGWCWWWRGWSCMGSSKGTQSGTEIPLGEMGVQSWN